MFTQILKREDLEIYYDITNELFQTNTYIVREVQSNEVIVIDPGGKAKEIIKFIEEFNPTKVKILNTHGHLDHILANPEIKERFNAEIYIHKLDAYLLQDQSEILDALGMSSNVLKLLNFKPHSADILLEDNSIIDVGNYELKVIHTPGHTRGSVVFYVEKLRLVFTGDVIFKQSIGRVDFPHSNPRDMAQSLLKVLSVVDKNSLILPGHGPFTTLKDEEKYLKYFINELLEL